MRWASGAAAAAAVASCIDKTCGGQQRELFARCDGAVGSADLRSAYLHLAREKAASGTRDASKEEEDDWHASWVKRAGEGADGALARARTTDSKRSPGTAEGFRGRAATVVLAPTGNGCDARRATVLSARAVPPGRGARRKRVPDGRRVGRMAGGKSEPRRAHIVDIARTGPTTSASAPTRRGWRRASADPGDSARARDRKASSTWVNWSRCADRVGSTRA